MHQIRVHLASIDCPLVGDKRYLPSKNKVQDHKFFTHFNVQKGHLLHASKIEFLHPQTSETITIDCSWKTDTIIQETIARSSLNS